MISIQSRLVNILLKLINKKALLRKRFINNEFDFFTSPEPPRKIYSVCKVNKYQVHRRNVFVLSPQISGDNKHILYLHGGAYVQSFLRPHWGFLATLVKRTNAVVVAPDYPLAPANTYKQAFAMVTAVYKDLTTRVNPSNLILMGDSAGGGFALALAQQMKMDNIPQPSKIILLSPWLDIRLNNPKIKDIDPSDYFLDVEGLKLAGNAYAGNTNHDFYQLSPINGPLEGLGEISIFIGSREILVADARKLKVMADEKRIKINYHEYAGMFHAWMLLNLPESKIAKEEIIRLVNSENNFESTRNPADFTLPEVQK